MTGELTGHLDDTGDPQLDRPPACRTERPDTCDENIRDGRQVLATPLSPFPHVYMVTFTIYIVIYSEQKVSFKSTGHAK